MRDRKGRAENPKREREYVRKQQKGQGNSAPIKVDRLKLAAGKHGYSLVRIPFFTKLRLIWRRRDFWTVRFTTNPWAPTDSSFLPSPNSRPKPCWGQSNCKIFLRAKNENHGKNDVIHRGCCWRFLGNHETAETPQDRRACAMIARKGHMQKMQHKHFSAGGRARGGRRWKKSLENPASALGMMWCITKGRANWMNLRKLRREHTLIFAHTQLLLRRHKVALRARRYGSGRVGSGHIASADPRCRLENDGTATSRMIPVWN